MEPCVNMVGEKAFSVAPPQGSPFHHLEHFAITVVSTTSGNFWESGVPIPSVLNVYRYTNLWVEAHGVKYTFSHELNWLKQGEADLVSFQLNRAAWAGADAAAAPGEIAHAMEELFSRSGLDALEGAMVASFHTRVALETISFCIALAAAEGDVADDVWRGRVESWLRSGGNFYG